MHEELLQKILKGSEHKITKGRLLIFRLLRDHPDPQTIACLVATAAGKVDRVSVYRIIELYEKLGIVKRITTGWKYKLELSDIFLSHHHHISCLKCGRMTAIGEDTEIEILIEKLGNKSGFLLTSHQLELHGYCAACQNPT